jgi:hypothetical protein
MSCCRYLSIAFHPDIPPAETKAELPKVEKLAKHLSEKSLLMYVLVNFQTHLDHLGNSNEKIRDEFMNFVELLMKRSKSYASLLLGQWIRNLKWPTKLHVDETLARLYLHLFLLYAAYTRKKKVTKLLLSFRSDLLHVEAGKGHPVTTKQLLENDTRVNPQSIIKLMSTQRAQLAGRHYRMPQRTDTRASSTCYSTGKTSNLTPKTRLAERRYHMPLRMDISPPLSFYYILCTSMLPIST